MNFYDTRNSYLKLKEELSKIKTQADFNQVKNHIKENIYSLGNTQLKELVESFNKRGGNLDIKELLTLKEAIDDDADGFDLDIDDEEYIDMDDDENFIEDEDNDINYKTIKVFNIEPYYSIEDINEIEADELGLTREEYLENSIENIRQFFKNSLGDPAYIDVPVDYLEDKGELEDYISNYISDETGYLVDSFDYEDENNKTFDEKKEEVNPTDIIPEDEQIAIKSGEVVEEGLKEAHYNDETGKVEPDLFYGIPEVEFIWHGEWNDPEVAYKGKLYNYYDLENSLYELFEDDIENGELVIDTTGYEDLPRGSKEEQAKEDAFEKWVKDNANLVYEEIELLEPTDTYEESLKKNNLNEFLKESGRNNKDLTEASKGLNYYKNNLEKEDRDVVIESARYIIKQLLNEIKENNLEGEELLNREKQLIEEEKDKFKHIANNDLRQYGASFLKLVYDEMIKSVPKLGVAKMKANAAKRLINGSNKTKTNKIAAKAIASENENELKEWFKQHTTNIKFIFPQYTGEPNNIVYKWTDEQINKFKANWEGEFDTFYKKVKNATEGADYVFRPSDKEASNDYRWVNRSANIRFDTIIENAPQSVQDFIQTLKYSSKSDDLKAWSQVLKENNVDSFAVAWNVLELFNFDCSFYKIKDESLNESENNNNIELINPKFETWWDYYMQESDYEEEYVIDNYGNKEDENMQEISKASFDLNYNNKNIGIIDVYKFEGMPPYWYEIGFIPNNVSDFDNKILNLQNLDIKDPGWEDDKYVNKNLNTEEEFRKLLKPYLDIIKLAYKENINESRYDKKYGVTSLPKKQKGGIIYLGLNVTSNEVPKEKQLQYYGSNLDYKTKIQKILRRNNINGATISSINDGEYLGNWEKSLTITILYIDDKTLYKVAKEIATAFKQDEVIVRNFKNNRIIKIKNNWLNDFDDKEE